MAGPPTRTQVEFLLPRRTPERAQADRPHDITGSLLCPQHSSSTGRRAPTRAPRAQGTGSGQRVPGKTARGCRRARGLAERATPSRLRGAGDSKGADDSSDPTRKSGQRGRLGRPAAAPARSLEMMYPGAQNGLREPLCCECHAHFGGRLPVPRAEAALPYWVPSSLRPREQSQRTVRFHVPKASESCPCLCHCVRGRLPVPRSQAMMPYWVPQVLRSPKKTVKRQRSFRGLQGGSWDHGRPHCRASPPRAPPGLPCALQLLAGLLRQAPPAQVAAAPGRWPG
nr:uncharacterized protein C16orf95 homolog isoform X8 [Oryctolagus cuniculus]XP_051696284.1 uncharacterized protein C16orf95 homolog isoform X8 [Oryctolagus cuniculus]